MCCLVTVLLVLGSRAAIIVWWFMDQARFDQAFAKWQLPDFYTIPSWAWTLVGLIFLPWTTLAYVFVAPGGIFGYEWLILVVGLLADLAGHGGTYRHRGYYRR
jgi:hypothetical protein